MFRASSLGKLYVIWTVFVIVLVFVKNGATSDNITHAFILAYLLLSLGAIFVVRKWQPVFKNPRKVFLVFFIVSAAVVEGFYMITSPVLPSLKIIPGMPGDLAAKNYLIDLLFTLPAYYVIGRVIWRLINKYSFSTWGFAFFMALGQALGDGSKTFLLNPGLLLFLPYIMINYHAMNFSAFLLVKNQLPAAPRAGLWAYIKTVATVFVTYLACGVVIYTVAAILKLK